MDNLRKGVIIKGGTCVGFTGRGVIPMTQEEFNALPPEKQLNGSYYITDGTDEIVISDNEVSEKQLWSSKKISDEVAEVKSKVDGLLDDSLSSETSTWSSSKIASEINPTIDSSKVFSNGALNIATLCSTYGNGRYVIVGQGTAGNGSATIDIWTLVGNAISYIVNVTYSNRTSNMFIGYTYDNPTINFETGYLNTCNHIAKVCTLA